MEEFTKPPSANVEIRRAGPTDAKGIVEVLEVVIAERIHSAIDRVWSVEQERRYLESLSVRETVHVAVNPEDRIIGLQILGLWSSLLHSMSHIGELGTFVLPEWRGTGVGMRLWEASRSFALDAGYRKLVIQVRASNRVAQSYYRGLGFRECGRLTGQVLLDDVEDDEILMECFLQRAG